MIVVNTCAFIDRAKQESVDAILEMAREKETGRARRLVVTGCLSQRYDAELRREIPEIDATLGTGQVERDRARGRRARPPRATQAGPELPDLGLRPHSAARALDAALARVREDQRGLRLHLLLLHHPEAARPAPQPQRRGHRERGARAGRARRARARAGGPGLDALRPGPRRARRPRLPAAPAGARGRHPLDPRDVRLPLDAQRQGARRDRLRGEGRQVRGHPAAARERAGAEADEAAHGQGQPARHGRADARARAGRRDPDLVHRRLPGRDRRGLREAARLRRGRPLRQRRRLHLLGRGGHDVLRPAGPRAEARQGVAGAGS